MAATCTHRVITPDTGNTPNTSGSIAYASGDLLVVFVTKEASALSSPMVSADLTVSSVTGVSSFTLIRVQGHQSSAAHMGVFVANQKTTGSGSSGTVTIAGGSDAGAGTIISVYTVAGIPASNVGASAVRQSGGQTDQASGTPAPAFPAAAKTGNACLGAIYNASNPAGMTQPSGWTEGGDSGYTTGQVSGLETCHRNSGETGTTITWGSSSASAFASIIIEVSAEVNGAATQALTFGSTTAGKLTAKGAATQALTAAFTTQSEKLTGVAKLSLASGSTPATRTEHSISVRARVTSGSGKLHAALYEGSTRIGAILDSSTLTTSLANYSLAISDAAAATISSYADLELRLWGSSSGSSIVFEVAEASLVIPAAPTSPTGAATQALAFTFTTVGKVTAKGRTDASFTLGETTVGKVTAKGRTDMALTLTEVTQAKVGMKGASILGLTSTLTTNGTKALRGASVLPLTLGLTTQAKVGMKGAVVLPLTISLATVGRRGQFGASVLPLTLGLTSQGYATKYGQVVLPLTIDLTSQGTGSTPSETLYGASVLDLVLGLTTNGTKALRGQVLLPLTVTETTSGKVGAKGAATQALTLGLTTQGKLTAKGQVSLPLTVSLTDVGKVTAKGQVVLPLTLSLVTEGQVKGKVYGATSMALALALTSQGYAVKHGQVILPLTLSETTQGYAIKKGQVVLPLTTSLTSQGRRLTFGQSSLPLTVDLTSQGSAGIRGRVALPLTLTVTSQGLAFHFGRVVLPLDLVITSQGHAELLAQVAPLDLLLAIISQGRREGAPVEELEAIWGGMIAGVDTGGFPAGGLAQIADTVGGVIEEEVA